MNNTWNVDKNDNETFYIVKFSGSTGNVFDMRGAVMLAGKDMLERVESYCNVDTACIEFGFFDDRLNMFAFHLIADTERYKHQHIAWIYSPFGDTPYWTKIKD